MSRPLRGPGRPEPELTVGLTADPRAEGGATARSGRRVAEHGRNDPGPDDQARRDPLDLLDPATRHAAQLAPPPAALAPPPSPDLALTDVPRRALVSMEDLLPQLVRRIAWAGDRRRGTVRMELGAGRHEGTTVTVHADGGRVRVEVDGGDVAELRSRIASRLERQGINVESVT